MIRLVTLILVLSMSITSHRPSTAQDGSPSVVDPASWTTPPGAEPLEDPGGQAGRAGLGGVTPIAAPIPFKDSRMGWGLALMAGLIHRFDADTTLKPSTGAIAGFYTENNSWGVAALEMARLARDTWRVRGVVSHFDVRYEFFGIGEDAGNAGQSVEVQQTMDIVAAAGLRRIGRKLYLGPSVLWMGTEGQVEESSAGLPPAGDLVHTSLVAPGLSLEYDTRDDDYWPNQGWLASAKMIFFSDRFGSAREFQRYSASVSCYTLLRGERVVLATNAHGAAATGDAPFYALPSIGLGMSGLRGYTIGRYRDDVMTTAQAELRFHSAGRLGATVFYGFGQVAPRVRDLPDAAVFNAGGVGLRFQLTRQFPMHMRLDYAWGETENLFYFSVGEAF